MWAFGHVRAIILFLAAVGGLIGLLVWFNVLPPKIGENSGESGELRGYLAGLLIDVSADPSSGLSAPLEDVDLTATVRAAVVGDITYRFDCTNDGSWEKTITIASIRFTAVDLCSYANPGTYTAKVRAETPDLTLENIAILTVSSRSLFADSLANPYSGPAPLNDVDLVAMVSGSARGDVIYKFDCTNDGIWERTVKERTSAPVAHSFAEDLCDYPDPGFYTATVYVERGGLSFQGSVAIVVLEQDN